MSRVRHMRVLQCICMLQCVLQCICMLQCVLQCVLHTRHACPVFDAAVGFAFFHTHPLRHHHCGRAAASPEEAMMPTRRSPTDTPLRHHVDQVLEDNACDLVDSSLGTFGCFINIQRRINSVFDGCVAYEVSVENQFMRRSGTDDEESTTPGASSLAAAATFADNPAPPPKSMAIAPPPPPSRSRSRSRTPVAGCRMPLTPKAPLAAPPIQLRLKGKPIGSRLS